MKIRIKNEFLKNFNITKLPDLNNLIEIDIPKYNKDVPFVGSEYDLFYNSQENYYIDKDGILSIYTRFEYDIVESYSINDGIFIGSNNGEWLGELIFRDYSMGLSYVEYKIIENECIHYIFPLGENVIILTGLGHLGTDEGFIYILNFNNDKYQILNKIDINSKPNLYKIINNELFIITNNGIIIFTEGKIITQLNDQKWNGLYANSLYINDKYIYIGTRACMFVVDRNNYNTKVYKINNGA